MDYKVQYPSPPLAPYIKQYWAMEGHLGRDAEHVQRIVPNGFAELIFYFGDLPENIDRPESQKARSVVNGQQSDYYNLRVTGSLSLLSVTFTPQGTRFFFNLPISEIYNRNLPLRILTGPVADRLEESIYEACTLKSRIEVIEKFFTRQLAMRREYEFNRITHSISHINRYRGITGVAELANMACLGRKQYERTFSSFVGINPKQFLRVVRFQNAISVRQENRTASLTSIAYLGGFSDQSHMVREFKAMSGLTPGEYFSFCEPVSDYFS